MQRREGTGTDSSEEKVGSEDIEKDRIRGTDLSEDCRIGRVVGSEDCRVGGSVDLNIDLVDYEVWNRRRVAFEHYA